MAVHAFAILILLFEERFFFVQCEVASCKQDCNEKQFHEKQVFSVHFFFSVRGWALDNIGWHY